MEERDSFVFYKDWALLRVKFPKQADKLINAIIDYGIYGKEPEDEEILLCFELIKNQIDRDRAKYDERAERSRRNGAKSKGAPTGNQNARKQPRQPTGLNSTQNNLKQPKQPKQPDNVNDNDNDNDNVNDNDNNFPTKVEKLIINNNNNNAREEKISPKEKEDGLTRRLLSDCESAYWEQAAMGLQIGLLGWSIPDIREMLPPFVDGCKAKDNYHRDLVDLKRHFYDWLKIQAQLRRKEKKQEQQLPKSPLDEFIRERLGYNPADIPPRQD